MAGVRPDDLGTHLGRGVTSWLIAVDGRVGASDFAEAASKLSTKFGKYTMSRFFCGEEDLVRVGEKTYAISNQWDISDVPAFQRIIDSYPELNLRFVKTES